MAVDGIQLGEQVQLEGLVVSAEDRAAAGAVAVIHGSCCLTGASFGQGLVTARLDAAARL